MSDYAKKFVKLGERLAQVPEVNRHDDEKFKEGWTLAHTFVDLDESFKKFSGEYLPKLEQENLSDKEIYDLLLDIGELFRHIQYHLKDPKFYRYLTENEDEK